MDGTDRAVGNPITARAASGFLAARWRGGVPVGTVFWRDMLVVGTAVNLGAMLLALALLAFGAPAWLSILVYAAPLPWNLFLVLSIHRSADAQQASHGGLMKIGSLLWLVAATLL